jgi:dihydroorotate dehydrogenase electron transfer subunit
VGPNIFHQRFEDRLIARQAKAGQFVQLLPGERHLFRRPFSVYAVDRDEGTFDVLYQIYGEGTACLARLSKGSEVDLLGPLGNRFRLPKSNQVPILVGGGLGMAPLRLFAEELAERAAARKNGTLPVMILGARHRALATAPFGLAQLGIKPYWATDDGSRGFRGTAVDLLAGLIDESEVPKDRLIVYGCGPEPMMSVLARFCLGINVACQVSMERSMPCGYGVCMGCVVTSKDGSGYHTYRRVCKDGPVFDADTIVF